MRKRYLIDKEFQTRFALEMLLFAVVVPFMVWIVVLMFGVRTLSPAAAATTTAGHGLLMLAVFQHQWLPMVLLYALNLVGVYLLFVYHSHRIAGPVYRFADALKRIGDGDLTQRVVLREHDFLKGFGADINRMAQDQTAAVQALRCSVAALKQANRRVNDPHIGKEIDVLEQWLQRYRVDVATPTAT